MGDDESDLLGILDRACEDLARVPSERLWEVATHCEVVVTLVDGDRSVIRQKRFRDVFPNVGALEKGIANRASEVRSASVALLAALDSPAAIEVFGELLRHDLSKQEDIYRAVVLVYPGLIGKVSPHALAEAWLAGRLPMSIVPTEGFSAIALERIVEAKLRNRALNVEGLRLVQHHPELRDGATAEQLLAQMVGTGLSSLAAALALRLGELKHVSAIPLLQRVLLGNDAFPHAAAGGALLSIGTTEALAPLVGLLEQDTLPTDVRLPLAVEATVRVDPRTSFDRLKHLFAPATLATPRGHRLACLVLYGNAKLLKRDARWLDFAVTLLGDFGLPARELLLDYKVSDVTEAIRRVGTGPARSPTHALPTRPEWLVRYRAGEHEAVWTEICALEDSIREPSVLTEAEAVATELMKRVRANLERIILVLKAKKYPFRKGAKALVPPGPKTHVLLQDLETLLGRPLPISVRAFHAVVGEVCLLAKADAPLGPWFAGFSSFEPFAPASLKEALSDLQKEAKREKAYPEPLRRPLDQLYFAHDPDFIAEPAEASNDRPIYLGLRGAQADACVELPSKSGHAPETTSFVAHLRRYLSRGGFLRVPEDEAKKEQELLEKGFLPF